MQACSRQECPRGPARSRKLNNHLPKRKDSRIERQSGAQARTHSRLIHAATPTPPRAQVASAFRRLGGETPRVELERRRARACACMHKVGAADPRGHDQSRPLLSLRICVCVCVSVCVHTHTYINFVLYKLYVYENSYLICPYFFTFVHILIHRPIPYIYKFTIVGHYSSMVS